MEYANENSLKALLESKKQNHGLASAVESIYLVNQYEVPNIVEKCTEKVEHLRDLFVKHLKPEEIREKKTLSFTIASSDQTSYTIAIKQKTVSLGEIDLLHRVFPNLKAINLYMFNLRYDAEETIDEADTNSAVSSIDMTLNTFPYNISKLIMYIFNRHGKNLTAFRINKGGNISNKDKKWQNLSEQVAKDGQSLLAHRYDLPKLETVEVCHFYQKFPMTAFVEALSRSNCVLQRASFIGVAKPDAIVLHLKKMAKDSLKTLALGTYEFPKLQDLQTFPLESLSLRWADSNTIDINSALNALPHIKDLDLGYDLDYIRLEESKAKLDQGTSLENLTLHHAVIDKHILDKIATDLPNLTKLTLSSCKFGSSRASVEETVHLLNYRLRELVLDNCALYFNKKDSIEKRQINKLNINIDSDRKYTAEIISKAKASMAKYEHVSNVKNQFSYTCLSETIARPTNTLTIMLKTIETIKLDTMGLKAVEFKADDIPDLETTSPATQEKEADNVEYGELFESLIEENVEQNDIEQEYAEIQSIEREQVVEEQIIEEQVIEKVVVTMTDKPMENEKFTVEENDGDSDEEKADNNDRRMTEMDKDFTIATDIDSTSSGESEEEEEEDLALRRSLRVRKVSASITERELRKRKRVIYNSSDESGQESDDDKPVRSTREKKRMRKFIQSIKSARPVIKVYPSKSLEGYYS
ncbi:hypothetical protein HMPREF1544_00828 [Mucor circinelloides 1006PhL]|uniref:Uncharacterized protein n=1 Tax=Mucor circinelloides f. circinelloides (strain 1006PhL) TaxID=1220926 RepID=S2JQJ8_MUCC1|nr:hypothetical protein HMPREF1544_00828 [Mucor circinelloides 1006PhL]